MAEPIRLWRGDSAKGYEEVQVYGVAQANALVAEGWNVGPAPAVVKPVTAKQAMAEAEPVQPAMDEAPTPAPKVPPKKAGEYGSHAGTQTNVVDKTKQAEVKAERAKDKAGK